MKTIAVMFLATFLAAIGETVLSYIMRRIEPPDWTEPSQVFGWVVSVISNPYILIGISFLIGFFFLYLATLSWADLSFVMPLTALSFVFVPVLAKIFLMEEVSRWRWIGILVIIIGITLVSFDYKQQATGHPTTGMSFDGQHLDFPE
jgi:drug/metabolite transporter (DMT)-like permease